MEFFVRTIFGLEFCRRSIYSVESSGVPPGGGQGGTCPPPGAEKIRRKGIKGDGKGRKREEKRQEKSENC